MNNVLKCMVESKSFVLEPRPSHGAGAVLGETEFYRGLLVAVAESITNSICHDQFCDRTHKMIGINVKGLIHIIIAGGGNGGGGSSGDSGGVGCDSSGGGSGGGWGHSRKSRFCHK